MNLSEINKNLSTLYNSKWENLEIELRKNSSSKDYASPLLLEINSTKDYDNQIKIMIFGQETRGWHGRGESIADVKTLMSAYSDYFFNRNMRHYHNNKLVATGAFRRGYVNLKKKLATENLEPLFIWNNLRKIGRDLEKIGVDKNVYLVEQTHFDVIEDELNIIKPNFLIFCTGPKLDNLLLKKLKNARIEQAISNLSKREFAKIINENNQIIGIRTYHPRSFYKALNNGGFKFLVDSLKDL